MRPGVLIPEIPIGGAPQSMEGVRTAALPNSAHVLAGRGAAGGRSLHRRRPSGPGRRHRRARPPSAPAVTISASAKMISGTGKIGDHRRDKPNAIG
jgi:hypothetical protein